MREIPDLRSRRGAHPDDRGLVRRISVCIGVLDAPSRPAGPFGIIHWSLPPPSPKRSSVVRTRGASRNVLCVYGVCVCCPLVLDRSEKRAQMILSRCIVVRLVWFHQGEGRAFGQVVCAGPHPVRDRAPTGSERDQQHPGA